MVLQSIVWFMPSLRTHSGHVLDSWDAVDRVAGFFPGKRNDGRSGFSSRILSMIRIRLAR